MLSSSAVSAALKSLDLWEFMIVILFVISWEGVSHTQHTKGFEQKKNKQKKKTQEKTNTNTHRRASKDKEKGKFHGGEKK